MAVKAIGMVKDFEFGGDGLFLMLDIRSREVHSANVVYGPVSPDVAPALLNSALRDFIKDHAINTFMTVFGPSDTAELVSTVDI